MFTSEQMAVVQSLLGPSVMQNIQSNPGLAALLGQTVPQLKAVPTPVPSTIAEQSKQAEFSESDLLVLRLFKGFLAEEENAHMAAGWAKFARYVQSEVSKLKPVQS